MADILEVTIERLGAQGDGIALVEGQPLYVPYSVPGDHLSVRVSGGGKKAMTGEILNILTPSPNRQDPPCEVFYPCGGCQLQQLNDDIYRSWLTDRLHAPFAQHGITGYEVLEPVISPPGTRRRLGLKALKLKDKTVLGFNKQSSHQLVDIGSCPVAHVKLTELFKPLRTLLHKVLDDRMPATVHLTLTASGVDILVAAAKPLSLTDREALADFADTHDIAALNWQDDGFLDPVVIRREPVMDFGGTYVALPPATFVQATAVGEAALVDAVAQGCSGASRVADLFAGIGTFTLPLAKKAQVLAVEGAEASVQALKAGVARAGGIKQVVTKHRDLYRRPLTATELNGFDAVVIDPPRGGAQTQCGMLAGSSVERIISVSCNPNTLARDAKILVDGGYKLISLLPVDQFLWSQHLEVVATFQR